MITVFDLDWQTSTEKDNDYFQIHRSVDMKEWELVGQVNGAGNSTEVLDYSMVDYNPHSGLSFYKLTQVDFNGESTTSEIRSVLIDDNLLGYLSIAPNPTSGQLKISGDQAQIDDIKLFNAVGQQIQFDISVSGESSAVIDISNVATGIYTLWSQGKSYKIVKE